MPDPSATDRSQRSDARHSRQALLAAARALVAESGPDGLTVVSVARRAGLNRSTAYQHFDNRDELVAAVGAEFARELRGMLREPRRFGEQIDFFVQYFLDHPDIARIWMFHLLSGQGDVGSGWEDYISALGRLADSSRSQTGVDAEMLGVIGMTSALVWSLMARARSTDEAEARADTTRFARELKRLFLYGALVPERWPDLVAELEPDAPPDR